MIEKRCSICQETKLGSEFYYHAEGALKLSSYCKPCNRAKCRERYWAKHDQELERLRGWREANRGYWPKWRRTNPDSFYASKARRRASERGVVDRSYVIARDKSICHICGKKVAPADIHLDHLVPICYGGEHSVRNLRVAHALCNRRRGRGYLPAQLLLLG